MKFRRTTSIGILASGLVAAGVAPATALSFFPFTTHFSGSAPTGDLFLDSIELDNGRTVDEFLLINSANILSNDLYTGGQTGGASADRGDLATVGLSQEAIDNADVVTALGNRYLSSIIDTEDTGSFAIDVSFDQPVRNLLFWERGGNSKLDLQALDSAGNPIGNLLNLSSEGWRSANFSLDTGEIDSPQPVTSMGLSLSDLGVSDPIRSIRLVSNGAAYNGADFKVVGTAAIPEPGTIAGLAIAGSLLALSRRRR